MHVRFSAQAGAKTQGGDGEGRAEGADTLVFDSSGGHYLREKRALMGILSGRHAQASAPSLLGSNKRWGSMHH